jgi:outer membrane protein OmpA-like peptidoglycan-associated protein
MRYLILFLIIIFWGCKNNVEKKPLKNKVKVEFSKKIKPQEEFNQTNIMQNLENKKDIEDFNTSHVNTKENIFKKIEANLSNVEVKKIHYNQKTMLLINLGPVVNFNTNKYDIKDKYKKNLLHIVDVLKDANQSILIVGHTDSVGSDRYNQALSELRAREVYKFFIQHGYDSKKIDYIGYGEEQPIATNATPQGRAKNRRVEVFVDGNFSFMYKYLKNRDINTSFLNNHIKTQAGRVEKTVKGWSKNLSEQEIKMKFVKLSKPVRENLHINLKKRVIIINLPSRELKEKK